MDSTTVKRSSTSTEITATEVTPAHTLAHTLALTDLDSLVRLLLLVVHMDTTVVLVCREIVYVQI